MKKLLSLLMLTVISVCALFGCGGGGGDSKDPTPTDYAGQATLDLTSTETKKLIANKDAYQHIDGDTTHFRQLDKTNSSSDLPESVQQLKVFKARYLAVNTPESTGEIEPWGKLASRFTKTKLASAESIVLESNGAEWETDANGRFLTWVWYKKTGDTTYRNLNLELLQEGLAYTSNISDDVRYAELAREANYQAQDFSFYLFSDATDPEFFTGEAIQTDLKTIRTHLDYFTGKRVAITATVTVMYGKGSIYVEDLDHMEETTGMYYGMPVFYGMGNSSWAKILKPGNKVFLAGEVSYSENFGYQICNLKYFPYKNDPENIRVVEENVLPAYRLTTLTEFFGKTTIEQKIYDADTDSFKMDPNDEDVYLTESKEYDYAALVLGTSISVSRLEITDVYTTKQGESEGAMSITCKDSTGKTVIVRTDVMYNDDGYKITEESFPVGSLLSANGIVDYYNDTNSQYEKSPYQIKVFTMNDLTVESK